MWENCVLCPTFYSIIICIWNIIYNIKNRNKRQQRHVQETEAEGNNIRNEITLWKFLIFNCSGVF